MAEHPKLHEPTTLCVEKQKVYGRVRFSACNELSQKFLTGIGQKTFTDADLKWIKTLGYDVLVIGSKTEEFE